MKGQRWIRRSLPILGMAIVWMVGSRTAIAAERVVLRYGPLQGSVPVSDLTTLAETGEAPQTLRAYLRTTGQDAEGVRNVITREVRISPRWLDRILESPVGDVVLDQIGQAIHTPSRRANRQAVRSALVLSVAEDGQFTLLEIMQNYPTQEVHVDGDRLIAAYERIQDIQEQVNDPLRQVQERLGDFLR